MKVGDRASHGARLMSIAEPYRTHHLLSETAFVVLAFVEPIDECLGRFTMGEKRRWLSEEDVERSKWGISGKYLELW